MSPRSEWILGRLAGATSVALVLTVAATAGTIAWPRVASAVGLDRKAARAAAYPAGTTIDTPAAWHEDAPYTLVLFARATCAACEKAMPYLKTLTASLRGRAAVVYASAGVKFERADEVKYARAIGIGESQVHAAPDGLKVRVTPTLVLVNQRGEVLASFEGVGPGSKQAVITQALDGLLK